MAFSEVKIYKNSQGFTLIELLVSVSIFAVVITLGMALFTQVLRVQRRVEVLRRANQAVRNTTDFLVKEIRNGRIDYGIENGATLKNPYHANCPQPSQSGGDPDGGPTYRWNLSSGNFGVAVVNAQGESKCIYRDSVSKALFVEKIGLAVPQRLTPPDVTVERFEVRVVPFKDPYMPTSGLAEIQPMAQILLSVNAVLPSGETKTINYQTSVSTNIYDIPRE